MMIQAKKNPESAVLTQALLFSAETSSKHGQGKLLSGLLCAPRNKQKGRHSDSAFKGSFGVNSEHFSWSVSREFRLMITIYVSVILVCDF